jgi:serine/threonine protein kinase
VTRRRREHSACPTPTRYVIERPLGSGAMGSVYLARDRELGRLVALKYIRAEMESDELRARFHREARSVAALNHPSIVTLFDIAECEGRLFLVFEYIEGRTLAAIIARRERLPLVQRLQLLEQLCDGLGYAHQAGLVHRDVKPGNLIVDGDGRLKVLDFGIATMAGAATRMTGLIGTPGYMAPEHIRGDATDHRADIFAVGAVAYELFSFRPAFPGDSPTAVIHRVLTTCPRSLRDGWLDGPTGLDVQRVIARALEKAAEHRYQTAIDLRDEWRRLLAAVEARHTSPPDTLVLGEVAARSADRPGGEVSPGEQSMAPVGQAAVESVPIARDARRRFSLSILWHLTRRVHQWSRLKPLPAVIANCALAAVAALTWNAARAPRVPPPAASLRGELFGASAFAAQKTGGTARTSGDDALRLTNTSRYSLQVVAAAFGYLDANGGVRIAHSGSVGYPTWDIGPNESVTLDTDIGRGELWRGRVVFYALVVRYPGVEPYLRVGTWPDDLDPQTKTLALNLD